VSEPAGSARGEDRRSGPVLFAYDGSELSKLAIDEAGGQLAPGRDALVLTVWQPFDVGFVPAVALNLDAAEIKEVKQAAQQTAAEGAELATAAGFHARGLESEAAPAWKGIVDAADERDASLIVLGSHGRTGLGGVLLGSVAEAVAAHSRRAVLIVHRRG
jgi:nucleotide-binding universal stress UspA family protein